MSQGFEVDLQVLDSAAEAVAQTMHAMQSCTVEDLCGDAPQYGHADLHAAFQHFCDRWQYGVEMLIEDGTTLTQVLNKVVETYVQADHDGERTMHASGSGVDPAAEQADG